MSERKQTQAGGTSFGFASVAAGERQGLVNEVFARVARRYDLMNDLMSAGVHRLWKDALIDWLVNPAATPDRILDVAGGTGDIASRFLARLRPSGGGAAVVCDINPDMLEAGRDARSRRTDRPRLFVRRRRKSALRRHSRFDAYTIAFGIRNVTHIDKALSEAYRVLKPGGRFLCLEFSTSQCRVLDDALRPLFLQRRSRRSARLVAGDARSLSVISSESIRRFPPQEAFAGHDRKPRASPR